MKGQGRGRRRDGGPRLRRLLFVAAMSVFVFALSSSAALAAPAILHLGAKVSPSGPGASWIDLEWTATGATGYDVYYSTDPSSGWTKLTTSGSLSATTTTFRDPSARTDYVNVFYKVEALGTGGPAVKNASVYPPHDNGHANYFMITDTCKNCHRSHRADGKSLLLEESTRALCDTCHVGMLGSKYDVYAGQTMMASGSRSKSLAGPFGDRTTGLAGDAWGTGVSTSSKHSYDENSYQVAGSADPPSALGSKTMTCLGCHAAHDTGNYRILKPLDLLPVEAWAVTGGTGEVAKYQEGMNEFCSSCHDRFERGENSARDKTGYSHYGHAVSGAIDMTYTDELGRTKTLTTSLPLEGGSVACQSCHFAHGTIATGTHQTETTNTPSESTMLKRLDQMGVCQDCHKK